MLNEETRKALHEIRDMVQSRNLEIDLQRAELQELRSQFRAHITECNMQAETLKRVEELLKKIDAAVSVTNTLRTFVIWVLPFITIVGAGVAVWK